MKNSPRNFRGYTHIVLQCTSLAMAADIIIIMGKKRRGGLTARIFDLTERYAGNARQIFLRSGASFSSL